MRLFVAIDLSDEARRALAIEQERLGDFWPPGHQPKFARADQLHLTLVFIGHVADEATPPFLRTISGSIDLPRFEMSLSGLGVFPPRGAPRILWVGVAQGADNVIRVQDVVAARLEALGVSREKRPYSPHLTLGRWRDSRPADAAPVRHVPARVLARVLVDGVTLYQSRLSSSGSTYTALSRALLT
jgi:2'-5' RNA ligase